MTTINWLDIQKQNNSCSSEKQAISSSSANEKFARHRMRMRQVAFRTHFTGSRRAPRLRAKSLPMLSCTRKGKFGWVNAKPGGKRRLPQNRQKSLDSTRKFCYIFNVAIPPLEPRVPLAPNAGAFGFFILGQFQKVERRCRNCHQHYFTFEEKKTDVNIAVELIKSAVRDEFDTAIIMSGDSDLVPAVEAVKTLFPAKKVGVVIPINWRAVLLKQVCDFHMKMKEKHLKASLFPDEIDLGGGIKLSSPPTWR